MTQQSPEGQVAEQPNRRGRGSNKPFPVMKFEDVLVLPESVSAHGVNGRIRRITLFDRLGKSPESGLSRQLITDSGKYGLTSGGYTAEYIEITETGSEVLSSGQPTETLLSKKFECTIAKFEVFRQLYERLVSQRVPADDVLEDLFRQAGIQSSDLKSAASVFVDNLRYLGLIREMSGSERIISIEQLLEELPASSEDSSLESPSAEPPSESVTTVDRNGSAAVETKRPALHIDIQVHIDATASPEQIDFIFASMAKHLYGLKS